MDFSAVGRLHSRAVSCGAHILSMVTQSLAERHIKSFSREDDSSQVEAQF